MCAQWTNHLRLKSEKDQYCRALLFMFSHHVFVFAFAVQTLQEQRKEEVQEPREEEVWQQDPSKEVPIW